MLSGVIHENRAQEVNLDMPVTLLMNNKTLYNIIDTLQKQTGIFIAHTSAINNLKEKITVNVRNMPLRKVLEEVLKGSGYNATFYHNQIILQPIRIQPEKFELYGYVFESDSITPVSYATISLKKGQTGVIADNNGLFELEISEDFFNDTLHISSMGYEPVNIPVINVRNKVPVHFYLKKKLYEIKPVFIEPESYRLVKVGNHKNRPSGSLYMDTHGQQVALFVNIEQNSNATIKTLWYYLSDEGNTDAPFRVRVYEIDTVTKKPGKDIMPEILVIKPRKKSGWFAVDVRQYNLNVCSPGFFIAMEGVFPNDYDFYVQGDDFINISTADEQTEINDDTPAVISYGQRLGYTKSRKNNNTWHYSLDHTWFQLRKQLFSIMVAADIMVYEKHNN